MYATWSEISFVLSSDFFWNKILYKISITAVQNFEQFFYSMSIIDNCIFQKEEACWRPDLQVN
jgi:hypothetical protein